MVQDYIEKDNGISKILLPFERDNLDIMAEALMELPDVIGL